MSTQENYKDDWLERAFQLAFFLHGDRETAKQIAIGAMNKLETASNAQFKRLYYTPTGRADGKASRSRVSLNDLQLLQRLVFVESEGYERRKEAVGKVSESDLLRFFIKHLVRIALKRNSFYVTLAISRILHSYPTAEAMKIYNIVVQDPERVHDDYYYRSRKGLLMKELKTRFGELLEIVKVNRGEERFDQKADAATLFDTAHECLRSFTPWNSTCSLPDKFDPFSDVIKPFHFDKKDPDEEHRTEVNRIHATLHPDCFDRLTRALSLSSPRETMEIPKFMIADNRTNIDQDRWNDPPSLNGDELEQIKSILSSQAASRKAAMAGFLRVAVDGVPFGTLDAANSQWTLDTDAELIEIFAQDGTLLATHLLNFGELRAGEQTRTIVLEGGQRITFGMVAAKDEFGEASGVELSISYAETAWRRRLASAWLAVTRAFGVPILRPALTIGLILLAVTAGWLVHRNFDRKTNELVGPAPKNTESSPSVPQPPQQQPDNKEFVANAPQPKDLNKQEPQTELANARSPRKDGNDRVPKKKLDLKLPEGSVANKSVPKDEVDENGILRLPMREMNREAIDKYDLRESRRSWKKKLVGMSFREVKRIYLEISGDAVLGEQIAKQLAEKLGNSGKLFVTTDKDSADAALKLYVRHESDVDDPEEKTVAVVARLVNARGYVIYPNRRGVSAWKYVGTIRKLPVRLAADLINAKR